MTDRALGFFILLMLSPPVRPVLAQCPDGSAPPCAHAATAPAPGTNSVGVMLFDNITRDTAYAYLSDGLASEIATTMARVPRLEVRSPGAVRSAQRGVVPDPQVVGRRLNVRYVVEGDFQRGGDRIRISVRLVALPSGTQRWSEGYTRPVVDLLAVQEEIASAVATAIAGQLLPQERTVLARRPTDNPRAYDHFLRANFYLAQRSPGGVLRAIEEYREALALDPSFDRAEARVALAYALYASWGWDYPGVPFDTMLAFGFRAADHALALDSTLADGWMARGILLYLRYPRTLDGAIAALERAPRLDPHNAEAWHQYAFLLAMVGRYDESVTAYRRALALEPRRAISWGEVANAYAILRLDTLALAALDSAVALDAEIYSSYAMRTWVHLRLGDRAAARADALAAMQVSPVGEEYFGLAPQAAVAAAEGDTAVARRLMDRALVPFATRPLGPVPALFMVPGLSAAGERDLALHWIERVEPRGALLWFVLQFPQFEALRGEPRFQRVVAESRPPGAN
ncbi:MAG TPA: tetratricopeptide repeat protein [Gemmatimonadales bacterium]|nr:tetratricopeptide repeat protein [Gemmatimonadales bacterium]